ncbi:MAG: hypothetical protein QGD91_04845 [Actinomycetota bacterium]|nr:hypothetical protein [Actinomycetota bacterium]MDK1103310.1 hypothetical protein [Actinomycetota bacterium]
MSHQDDAYGAEIRDLSAKLGQLPSAMRHPALENRIHELQREINVSEGPLRSAKYRQDELKTERRWIESDVHGFKRALVLVGQPDGVPDSNRGGSAQRFRTKLESRVSRTIELTEEIDEFQNQIDRIETVRLALSVELVEMLHGGVADAERNVRKEDLARKKRLAALRAEMGAVEKDILWSPTAVHGYRVWTFEKDGLYGAQRPWRSPRFSARCSFDGEIPHTDGRCATVAFGCGIYAAKSVEVLMDEVDGDLGRQFVVGLVGLEGRVVEHDRGYRGEQATVLAATIVNRGTLLMTDDAGELQRMFRDPRQSFGVGAVSPPSGNSDRTMQAAIRNYLEKKAERYQTWTSANSSE